MGTWKVKRTNGKIQKSEWERNFFDWRERPVYKEKGFRFLVNAQLISAERSHLTSHKITHCAVQGSPGAGENSNSA